MRSDSGPAPTRKESNGGVERNDLQDVPVFFDKGGLLKARRTRIRGLPVASGEPNSARPRERGDPVWIPACAGMSD